MDMRARVRKIEWEEVSFGWEEGATGSGLINLEPGEVAEELLSSA